MLVNEVFGNQVQEIVLLSVSHGQQVVICHERLVNFHDLHQLVGVHVICHCREQPSELSEHSFFLGLDFAGDVVILDRSDHFLEFRSKAF